MLGFSPYGLAAIRPNPARCTLGCPSCVKLLAMGAGVRNLGRAAKPDIHMKPSSTRTAFAFLLLGFCVLLPGLATAQDNLLTNGDFRNGTQSWEGDFADSSGDDSNPLAAPSDSSSGQVIALHDMRAVRVFQPFDAGLSSYLHLLVKFAYSSDSASNGDGKIIDVVRGFGESPNAYASRYEDARSFSTPVAVVANSAHQQISSYILSTDKDGKSQDYDVQIYVQPHWQYRLYIAFPPGRGSVTLTSVLLSTTAPPPPEPTADTSHQSSLPPAPVVTPQPKQPPAIPIVSPSQ